MSKGASSRVWLSGEKGGAFLRIAHSLSETQHLQCNEICSKLRAELNANTDHGQNVSRAAVAKLTYLSAVIKESMRLFPVAPLVVRKIVEDLRISGEDGGDQVMLTRGEREMETKRSEVK